MLSDLEISFIYYNSLLWNQKIWILAILYGRNRPSPGIFAKLTPLYILKFTCFNCIALWKGVFKIWWLFSPRPRETLNMVTCSYLIKTWDIAQGFFLCKTEKPRSEFWKTQIAKFSKNSVLSQKPSSNFLQNQHFPEDCPKNH